MDLNMYYSIFFTIQNKMFEKDSILHISEKDQIWENYS